MSARRAILGFVLAALAASAAAWPGRARAEELPARSEALVLLRVLAYDRNLVKRTDRVPSVLVVARQGDRASESRCERLAAALETVAREIVVAGLPVKAEVLSARDPATLETRFDSGPPALVVVDEAFAASVPDIARLTRRRSVFSAGSSRSMVEAGLSVAVLPRQGRAGVVVNLQAARLEGVDLGSGLLALVEVVREADRAP